MCKFCGTRFCSECLCGEFYGLMKAPDHCRKCNQVIILSLEWTIGSLCFAAEMPRQTRGSGGLCSRHRAQRTEEIGQRQSVGRKEIQEEEINRTSEKTNRGTERKNWTNHCMCLVFALSLSSSPSSRFIPAKRERGKWAARCSSIDIKSQILKSWWNWFSY